MPYVLANTGVQILCFPLPRGSRLTPEQTGTDWNHCRTADARSIAYVQWRVVLQPTPRLFLAIDTTCGDPAAGHFCSAAGFVDEHIVRIAEWQGADGQAISLPAIEFSIRPPVTGNVKDVDMVIDFGNSRTGALLLEMRGETAPTPQMLPFHLYDRARLDAWNDAGEFDPAQADKWFSSRTHWSVTPYAEPQPLVRDSFREVETKKGLLGRTQRNTVRESQSIRPQLFEDVSMVRLGSHAKRIASDPSSTGDQRTGVSSPKRYLWADDASWLEGCDWFMDTSRSDSRTIPSRLSGPLLRFLSETDDDTLLDHLDTAGPAMESPARPRHAPRVLMTAALYEILSQAFAWINSPAYRKATGDASRPRRLRSVTLTYPTGMITVERERLLTQATKAARVFAQTIGRGFPVPAVELGLDEASAVHLAYVWGELRSLGQNPALWMSIAAPHRAHTTSTAASEATSAEQPPESPLAATAAPARRRPTRSAPEAAADDAPGELRIACIDIGGGTSDLMIAGYQCRSQIDDEVTGRILHRDGISIAGDQLVKRILERIIVPVFADATALDRGTVQLLFGPEVPHNRELRSLRTSWMNHIFVPLAHAWLGAVSKQSNETVCHTDERIVSREALHSLQTEIDRVTEPGRHNVNEPLRLDVDAELLMDVVQEVFGELIADFCERIVRHEADIVLLAGQPTRLNAIQDLVRMMLPLPSSRVIAMHRHYAGNWYPYQDEQGRSPGFIVEPKSAVVVGAAVEFLARHGHLPQFRFQMTDTDRSRSWYWGVMTDAVSGIREERVLFKANDSPRRHRFTTSSQRVMIGRRLSAHSHAEASPGYLLMVDTQNRVEPTEITIELERRVDSESGDEQLELVSVDGLVAGLPAVIGQNVSFHWRTLADEQFFLDSGGLDHIDLD